MKSILVLFFISLSNIFANEVINIDSVYKEGIEIYRNARASWLGNELLISLLQKSGKDKSLAGYFAYPKDDGNHFVFYDTNSRIIAEAFFDSTFKTPKNSISFNEREFDEVELNYFKIKQGVKEFQKTDTVIKYFENTGLNQIPIIYQGKMKCYLLTAPVYLGEVIYGNDYCIDFDKNYKVTKITDIHKTIISIPFVKDSTQSKSYHTHTEEVGYLPSTTDIATTFLYGEMANWSEHYIQSSELLTKLIIKDQKMHITKIPKQNNQQNSEKILDNNSEVPDKKQE